MPNAIEKTAFDGRQYSKGRDITYENSTKIDHFKHKHTKAILNTRLIFDLKGWCFYKSFPAFRL